MARFAMMGKYGLAAAIGSVLLAGCAQQRPNIGIGWNHVPSEAAYVPVTKLGTPPPSLTERDLSGSAIDADMRTADLIRQYWRARQDEMDRQVQSAHQQRSPGYVIVSITNQDTVDLLIRGVTFETSEIDKFAFSWVPRDGHSLAPGATWRIAEMSPACAASGKLEVSTEQTRKGRVWLLEFKEQNSSHDLPYLFAGEETPALARELRNAPVCSADQIKQWRAADAAESVGP